MAETFQLSVITPTETLLDEQVSSIVVPGSEGYLGVLANHAPLITALAPGRLEVRDAAGEQTFYALSGGFLEVSNNKAILLADSMELTDHIDLERAKSAEARARRRLEEGSAKWDVGRAQDSLDRALNRQKFVN